MMHLNLTQSTLRTVHKSVLLTLQQRRCQSSKVYERIDDAMKGIKSGDTLLSGGFGLCGLPETLLDALSRRPDVKDLVGVSNNAGIDKKGLNILMTNGQIKKMISSYIGGNKHFEKCYLSGEIELELTPQGTLAERIRAGAAGIPAFFTPTGLGTPVQDGSVPLKNDPHGQNHTYPTQRETREFKGKQYLMERAIEGDVAFVKAWKADQSGNLIFRYTANNFNSVMAKNAKLTIVEAEEIVEIGQLDPMQIHVPGIYVDRIVQSTIEKSIEIRSVRPADVPAEEANPSSAEGALGSGDAKRKREMIVQRAARELKDGFYVNLGIGMPTLIPSHLPKDRKIWLQSENGLLGMGPLPTEAEVDADIINAGKETVTLEPGAAVFGSEESFAMIRGGHVDVSVLGAMEVASNGDLANWIIPGKLVKGMGGAMDLVASPDATKIVVVTDHMDKKGNSKIVAKCSLPLTGAACVSTIITDLAVFEIDRKTGIMTLIETMPGASLNYIRQCTNAPFEVSADLKEVDFSDV